MKKNKKNTGGVPNLDSAFGPMQTYRQIQNPRQKTSMDSLWSVPKDTNPYIRNGNDGGGMGRPQEPNQPWTTQQNLNGGTPPILSNPMGTAASKKKSLLPIFLSLAVILVIIGIAGRTAFYLLRRDTAEPINASEAGGVMTPDETAAQVQETVNTRFGKFYYYSLLTPEEQAVYEVIYDGLMAYNEKIVIEADLSQDSVERIENMVWKDSADIFWLQENVLIQENNTWVYVPVYSVTKEEGDRKRTEIDAACEEIVQEVQGLDTTYKKVRRVYEYICQTVEYVEGSPDDQNMYSSIVLKKSVCTGYAKGFLYLMEKLDIPCALVNGTAGGGEHVWNVVKIDGQWYQVDVTWADPLEGDGTVYYEYLCAADDVMYQDHTPHRPEDTPKCTDDSLYMIK